MRILVAISCLICVGAASALDTARQLLQSGAPRLALNRVEQLQPRDPNDPRWAEWEALRMGLLVRLSRNDEALARAAALPANMPLPVLRRCLLEAARAAVASGQGITARDHAVRLLWQLDALPEEVRAARLLAIDSYVADRQGDAAFRAMLRFQQDHQPLERGVAAHFVEALLALGMEREAVNWLASLDDAGATSLMLQLKSGLVSSDGAVAQARARIVNGGEPGYWKVLAEAARRQGSRKLHIEALERLLDADGGRDAAAPARALWDAYYAGAQEFANQNQLLTGDDGAWYDFAARRLGADSLMSRALFAHVAQRGQIPATRQNAQLQLVFSLQQAKLELTALRLFADDRIEAAALEPRARYLLGAIGESHDLPDLAARFWQGLPVPPGVAEAEWSLRLAPVYWRAGMSDAAISTVRSLLRAGTVLPADGVARIAALAQEFIAAGRLDIAEEALSALAPLADPVRQRDILFALGGIAENSGRFALAAEHYLRSALPVENRTPDALALQARLAAALNLARAGYRDDARAQFNWLLKNSRDPAHLEIARRELAKL